MRVKRAEVEEVPLLLKVRQRHQLEVPAVLVQVLGALERILTGRVDHFGLPRSYGGQHFLPFPLRHVKILERAVDLRPDIIELFRGDVKMLVGLAKALST